MMTARPFPQAHHKQLCRGGKGGPAGSGFLYIINGKKYRVRYRSTLSGFHRMRVWVPEYANEDTRSEIEEKTGKQIATGQDAKCLK